MRAVIVGGLWLGLIFGCSAEEGGGTSGPSGPASITLKGDQGVVFETGELIDTGAAPFSKADLYAIEGGTNGRLQLDTGKENSTKPSSPVTWFQVGGIASRFDSLDDVPNTKPKDDQTSKLLGAEQGNGFVTKNFLSDGYTKGWVSADTGEALTIEYEALP